MPLYLRDSALYSNPRFFIDIKINIAILLTMFDIRQQKQIAIQHAHNTTGDFTTCFADTGFGETMVNPSSEGITFFRPQGTRTPDQQIGAFDALHTILSPVGGLNTVIVFGDTMGSNIKDGIDIAKGIKEIDSEIKTILLSLESWSIFREKDNIFQSEISKIVEDDIAERRVEFVTTKDRTTFEARFESDKNFTDSLDIHFNPASHFDVVVSKFMRWPETFREIANLPAKERSPQKDWRWNRDMQKAYEQSFPQLEKWEDMVRARAPREDWQNFKRQILSSPP